MQFKQIVHNLLCYFTQFIALQKLQLVVSYITNLFVKYLSLNLPSIRFDIHCQVFLNLCIDVPQLFLCRLPLTRTLRITVEVTCKILFRSSLERSITTIARYWNSEYDYPPLSSAILMHSKNRKGNHPQLT